MKTLGTAAIRCSLIFLLPLVAYAGSATWGLNPTSGDWNSAANWTPMTVPNGSGDTATFALSNTTSISISANTVVDGITFTPAATTPYTITANPNLTLTLSGAGITNNSGTTQSFVMGVDNSGNIGTMAFTNSATAGNMTAITTDGALVIPPPGSSGLGGRVQFTDSSTAGSAAITNKG